MSSIEAVYRYGSTDGKVVHRHEVGPDTRLPSEDETITLPGRDSERQFVVTSRLWPTTTLVEGRGIRSAFTIVLEHAR